MQLLDMLGAWLVLSLPFLAVRRALTWVDPDDADDAAGLKVTAAVAAVAALVAFALPGPSNVGDRAWWAVLSTTQAVGLGALVGSALLGLLAVRLERVGVDGAALLAATPLLLVATQLPPRSALVEMARSRPPVWRDGVCLQSTGFTCTAAAGATLLRAVGIAAEESEMAARCATGGGGTRVLGLAEGLSARLQTARLVARARRFDPADVATAPLPLVAFSRYHAFVVFDRPSARTLEIGDPLHGRVTIARRDFEARAIGVGVVLTRLPGPGRALQAPWASPLAAGDREAVLRFGDGGAAPWPAVR